MQAKLTTIGAIDLPCVCRLHCCYAVASNIPRTVGFANVMLDQLKYRRRAERWKVQLSLPDLARSIALGPGSYEVFQLETPLAPADPESFKQLDGPSRTRKANHSLRAIWLVV
jgi:hypothetical protein